MVHYPDNVVSLWSGPKARKRLQDLFSRFAATYDRITVVNGKIVFGLWAPGPQIEPSLFRGVIVKATCRDTGMVVEARILEVDFKDGRSEPERGMYCLRTGFPKPFNKTLLKDGPRRFKLELISSDGHCRFEGTDTALSRADRKHSG